MAEKRIKSGPEIVKEFIERLRDDKSLDKGTVEVIEALHAEKKLTQTRLEQGLELKRKESGKDG